jgi:hypothetical protein
MTAPTLTCGKCNEDGSASGIPICRGRTISALDPQCRVMAQLVPSESSRAQ